MRILVIGGAGFAGADFVRLVAADHPDDEIVVVDSAVPAGLRSDTAGGRVRFVVAALNDMAAMAPVMAGCGAVVNFSGAGRGTAARHLAGLEALLELAVASRVARFHQVSRAEVFGALSLDHPAPDEETPYAPATPAAAATAAADHLVRAYGQSFGLAVSVTIASPLYGPGQAAADGVGQAVACALDGVRVPVAGHGKTRSDHLFVSDHSRAVDTVLRHAQSGTTYCVGAGEEHSPIEVAQTVLAMTGLPEDLIEFIPTAPGVPQGRHTVTSARLADDLYWRPRLGFEEGLEATIGWFRANIAAWRHSARRRPAGLSWG
jgi:dTDP-glucose 4,6-dehydratase